MKKVLAMLLAAMLFCTSFVGCKKDDKNKKRSSQKTASSSVSEKSEKTDDSTEYSMGGLTYNIPKAWKLVENPQQDKNEYQKFECDDFSVSIQFKQNIYIDTSKTEEEIITQVQHMYLNNLNVLDYDTITVENVKSLKLTCKANDGDDDLITKVICQSESGIISFNFFDCDDFDLLNETIMKFVKTISGVKEYDPSTMSKDNEWADLQTINIDNLSFSIPSNVTKKEKEDSEYQTYHYESGYFMLGEVCEPLDFTKLDVEELVFSLEDTEGINVTSYEMVYIGEKTAIRINVEMLNISGIYLWINTDNHLVSLSVFDASEDHMNEYYSELIKTIKYDEKKPEHESIKIDDKEYAFADYEKYNVEVSDAERLDGSEIYITGTIKKYVEIDGTNYAIVETKDGEWYANFFLWVSEYTRDIQDVYDVFPKGSKKCTIIGTFDANQWNRDEFDKPIIKCYYVKYNGETYDRDSFYHEDTRTTGQINALNRAKSYLKYMSFSYSGLIEQLEYEGYTYDEAVYGADNCGADWYEQAAKKARSYIDYMSFSRESLIDQLLYEGFTYDEAEYGVQAVGY